jgi:putative DNA primase/helicase
MMTLAQTEAGLAATAGDFDADPFLFNCLSGTLDLRTGTLHPHARGDRLTKVAPVHYDPTAPRPLFDAFVDRIMGGNRRMVDYLARVLGLCLSGDVSIQELYFFIGEGANGKSVLIDTVLGLLGAYATVAPESLLLLRAHPEHATEIADLCGRRLVVASETEEGAQLKVQLVKRLTGDARLKGRFMRRDFFEFDRTHKLVIVSNNRPVIRETKHAVWRRVRLVPFEVIIPEAERDTQLTEKLKAEWSGILSWLVAGYRYARSGLYGVAIGHAGLLVVHPAWWLSAGSGDCGHTLHAASTFDLVVTAVAWGVSPMVARRYRVPRRSPRGLCPA